MKPAPPPFTWARQAVLCTIGAVLAWMPVLRWVIMTLQTLVHEIGHALASWFFARPAVPAFDFSQGGGFTIIRDRATFLMLLLAVAWAWLGWLVRSSPRLLIAVGVAALLWAGAMLTGFDQFACAAMGHGGVYLFVGIFLARNLTGLGIVHAGEQPLYGALAWALWWREMSFSFQMLTDAAIRARYWDGKRGVDNDLVSVAQMLGCSLETALCLHLAAGMACAAAVYVLFFRFFPPHAHGDVVKQRISDWRDQQRQQ